MDHEVRCTNGRTDQELTLKCKLKCYVKPMKDPLGVSPSEGTRGTTTMGKLQKDACSRS